VERQYLERCLADGMSLEAIGKETGQHASTVAYWLRKYGMAAVGSGRFAPRGGIERGVLQELVDEDLPLRAIAERLGRSMSTVGYWMRRYGLKTRRAQLQSMPLETRPRHIERACTTHGVTTFGQTGSGRHYRCLQCRAERVAQRRRDVKATLVGEAGGRCQVCGYERCIGALQFHHIDPREKRFHIALGGVARSLERARSEARKCVLLCANCHAEVEAGVVTIPLESCVLSMRSI
jgi:transposase